MRREKRDYVVITFHTTAEAMAAEKYCMAHEFRGRLIPVPGEISAGCGICWRMTAEDFEAAEQSTGLRAGHIFEQGKWLAEVKHDRIVKLWM